MSNKKPLLNDLIRWGQVRPALWALSHGASPNRRDDQGWTALHQAVSRGNLQLLEACLGAGADVTIENNDGRAAADLARTLGRTKFIPLLGLSREVRLKQRAANKRRATNP
jgi:ankyrin repeat protein